MIQQFKCNTGLIRKVEIFKMVFKMAAILKQIQLEIIIAVN